MRMFPRISLNKQFNRTVGRGMH